MSASSQEEQVIQPDGDDIQGDGASIGIGFSNCEWYSFAFIVGTNDDKLSGLVVGRNVGGFHFDAADARADIGSIDNLVHALPPPPTVVGLLLCG